MGQHEMLFCERKIGKIYSFYFSSFQTSTFYIHIYTKIKCCMVPIWLLGCGNQNKGAWILYGQYLLLYLKRDHNNLRANRYRRDDKNSPWVSAWYFLFCRKYFESYAKKCVTFFKTYIVDKNPWAHWIWASSCHPNAYIYLYTLIQVYKTAGVCNVMYIPLGFFLCFSFSNRKT